jgi:hypothetical protein
MDSPVVTAAESLRTELSGKFADSIKVTSTLDANMRPVDAEARVRMDAPSMSAPERGPEAPQAPQAPTPPPAPSPADARMAKVLGEAQKVRAERAAVAQERAQYQAELQELAQFRQMKAIAKEDPVAWAEFGGYSKPDEYATTLMEKGTMSPDRRKILEQAQQLNSMQQKFQQFEQKQQQAQVQGHYQTVVGELTQFATQNADRFDLVARTKSYDQVLGVINQHYQATQVTGEPEVMSYEQACEIVETQLEQQYAPMLESPKFRSRLGQEAPAAPLAQQAARKPAGINSKMRAASAPPAQMTEAERLQKAGEIFLGQIYSRR